MRPPFGTFGVGHCSTAVAGVCHAITCLANSPPPPAVLPEASVFWKPCGVFQVATAAWMFLAWPFAAWREQAPSEHLGSPSCASGVGQFFAAPVNESVDPGWLPQLSASSARALGQREESEPSVRCADLLRAKESARKAVTHSLQFFGDFMEAESKMGVHVFEEDLLGLDFADDAGDVRPEMARVLFGKLLSRATEGLTRVARSDRMNAVAPRFAREGFEIAPNWRIIQGAVLNTRDQNAGRTDFPFHVACNDKASRIGKGKPEVES